jgi:hypothetical protein
MAAWAIALGWPSDEEIDEHKAAGWYAAPAVLTWEVHARAGHAATNSKPD